MFHLLNTFQLQTAIIVLDLSFDILLFCGWKEAKRCDTIPRNIIHSEYSDLTKLAKWHKANFFFANASHVTYNLTGFVIKFLTL